VRLVDGVGLLWEFTGFMAGKLSVSGDVSLVVISMISIQGSRLWSLD
jgi:hypothetical protein